MAPAQIPVFLSQKPSTKNGIIRAAILFLAWTRKCARCQPGRRAVSFSRARKPFVLRATLGARAAAGVGAAGERGRARDPCEPPPRDLDTPRYV